MLVRIIRVSGLAQQIGIRCTTWIPFSAASNEQESFGSPGSPPRSVGIGIAILDYN